MNVNIFYKILLITFILLSSRDTLSQTIDTLYPGITAFELINVEPNEIIAGSEAGIVKSTDYGNTWTEAEFDVKPSWVDDISFDSINPDIGYAAAGSRLYKTSDGGLSWLTIDQLDDIYLVDINPHNSNIILAQGAEDTFIGPFYLYRSTDSGLTWSDSVLTGFIRDISFNPSENSIVFGRTDFQMLRSTDLGKTWETRRGITQGNNFSALSVVDSTILIAENELLFKSTDNGNNWHSIGSKLKELVPSFYIRSILPDIHNPDRIYLALREGIYLTEDNGNNWTRIYRGSSFMLKADNENPRNIYFTSTHLMSMVDTFTVTSLSGIREIPPATFELKQNYPNPVSINGHTTFGTNKTTIEYTLVESGYPGLRNKTAHSFKSGNMIKLTLYNSLGQKTAVLVDKYQSAGSYKVQFDVTGLTSGIYFYNLTDGYYSETRKMVLTK